MANPQKEDGFIPIATEIFEALCKTRIPGEARQVLDTIIRFTYGWRKKQDHITLSQFQAATGLRKQYVQRALAKLVALNLVTKKGYGTTVTYSLNKDYETWNRAPKKGTTPIKGTGGPNKGYKGAPIKGPSIDKYIDINTKDKYNVEIREIIADLNAVTGKKFRPTTEPTRKAISARLGEGYTVDDFRYVHRVKVAEWKGTDRDQFLCPDTLYRPSKFEKYRQQQIIESEKERTRRLVAEVCGPDDGKEYDENGDPL